MDYSVPSVLLLELQEIGGEGEIRTLGTRRHGGLANHCTRPTMRPLHIGDWGGI